MKTTLLFTFCTLAVISSVNGLNCWLCVGSTDSDCFRGEERSMVPVECPNFSFKNATVPNLLTFQHKDIKKEKEVKDDEIVTVCVSFMTNQLGPSLIERNCGYIYKDVDICEYMNEINVGIYQYCSSCNDDLCNNVEPTSISVNVV